MKIGEKRTIKRFAYLPTWVWVGEKGKESKWIWLKSFSEKQKFDWWNDWQEGVGNHWKSDWRTERRYI